jgi:hypothetical protein
MGKEKPRGKRVYDNPQGAFGKRVASTPHVSAGIGIKIRENK